MTESERYLLIIRLKCCSATLADCISTKLQKGGEDSTQQLMLLNGLLDIIIHYDVSENATNCVTSDEFDEVVDKAKNICSLCDCE